MKKVSGKTFSNGEKVETDGKAFVDCRFEKASLVYGGGDHPSFTDCGFGEVGWYFTGGALRTIQFLQQINASPGGADFIADMFKPGQYITE